MYALIKSVHFLTLALLLGGPFFWFGVWGPSRGKGRATADPAVDAALYRRVRLGVILGTVLFSLSALADAVRAAAQVFDPRETDLLLMYLQRTRYGQVSVLKAALAPVFLLLFLYRSSGPGRRAPRSRLIGTGLVLVGITLAAGISFTSHAAARPDFAPVVVDLVHQLAGVVWGGGVIFFAALPWALLLRNARASVPALRAAVHRFSFIAMLAVLAVGATGAISSYLHVYDLNSVRITPYGRTLVVKVLLFLLVMGAAAVNLLVVGPGLEQLIRRRGGSAASAEATRPGAPLTTERVLRYLRAAIAAEAVLILGVLVAAGTLTTYPPASEPGFVAEGAWEADAGPYRVRLEMASTSETGGGVEIGIYLLGEGVPPVGDTLVYVDLEMLDHEMGTSRLAARPLAPGYYGADGVIAMAGSWEARVEILEPDGDRYLAVIPFEAASGALDQGRIRRLDVKAAWSVPAARLPLLLGVLLVAMAIAGIAGTYRGVFASWAAPVGMGAAAIGLYQVLSLTLVSAYPTTYLPNPVPYTAETVARGEVLYQAHCAVCHGDQGYGDGPAAAALNPRPADLTAPHVDDHTDGDIFWWLTNGIPGTAMPGWGDSLTEEERWILVQYVRNLRHGIPLSVAPQ